MSDQKMNGECPVPVEKYFPAVPAQVAPTEAQEGWHFLGFLPNCEDCQEAQCWNTRPGPCDCSCHKNPLIPMPAAQPVPAQVAEPTCPMCEFEQKPCPGGAHAFALWEDGIRTVEDYAKMRAAQPVSAPSPEIPEDLKDIYEHAIKFPATIVHAEDDYGNETATESVDGMIVRLIERIERAESALRTAREERASTHTVYVNPEGMNKAEAREMVAQLYRELQAAREEFQALLNKSDAEREARKQEAVEQFNAGIEAAAQEVKVIGQALETNYPENSPQAIAGYAVTRCVEKILARAKSVSGSPERLEGPGK